MKDTAKGTTESAVGSAMNPEKEHFAYTPPRWFNKAIAWILCTPMHVLVSKDIMLLTVTGRKTGKRYPMPVSYARDGDLIICSTDRTRADWWKNLHGGATVTLRLCGKEVSGEAKVISEDRQALIKGINTMLTQVPRDAKHYEVRLDENKKPLAEDVSRATAYRIIIEIQDLRSS
jgi:deazaflavin-dependent oxidoreductase (nitroreductase family)